MAARLSILAGGMMCAIVATKPAHAQTNPAPLQQTDGFRVGYGMSFMADACGDQHFGELLRRAIMDRFGACPFTDDARREFLSWTAETRTEAEASMRRYIAEHGKLPDRLDGMKETCQESHTQPDYLRARNLLEQYAQGEIAADAIITNRCDDQQGGGP